MNIQDNSKSTEVAPVEMTEIPRRNAPFLVTLLEDYICIPCGISPKLKRTFFLASVWIITYICYASYHLSRKPTSVVKGTLRPKCVEPYSPDNSSNTTSNSSVICLPGWEPFDGPDGNTLLGSLDYSFLFSYAIAMFFSGHLGDRVSLRYFLTIGMIGSGLMVCLFGAGYFFKIHVIEFYIAVQIAAGIFQSTGWPGVVAVMNHWFGKGYRGFVLGVWNTHTSVGNILGSVIPGIWADTDWGWSFISAGLIIIVCGVLVFLTLVSDPNQVDLAPPTHNKPANGNENDLTPLIAAHPPKAIGFFNAFLIPGVIEYSFALFFGKLVSYTFLFWLPLYIQNTEIGGKHYSGMVSADLSTIYDVGGIIGGILGGLMSDIFNTRSVVCVVMYYLAIPSLYGYLQLGHVSLPLNIGLMCLCGILVNGPYGLITTAVTADLGTHPSLRGNTNAKATVTAIIDGTGSIGAAMGPLLAGWVSGYSWSYVFYIQMGSCLIAALLLSRLVLRDCIEFVNYVHGKFSIF